MVLDGRVHGAYKGMVKREKRKFSLIVDEAMATRSERN
jgi:hypothetical protein